MFSNIYHTYKKINLYLYRILAGNVGIQLLFLSIAFLIIFFILQYLFGVNDSLLFHQMTAYEYDKEDNSLSLKIIYLVGVIFFSGFLVMILTNGVRNQLDRINAGDARFSFKDHILFFGYNEEAESIIQDIIEEKQKKISLRLGKNISFSIPYNIPDIVVVANRDVVAIKEAIEGHFGKMPFLHVLHGSYNDSDLRSYHTTKANSIYIIGDSQTNTDFKNLELYKNIYKIANPYSDDYYSWFCKVYLFLHDPSSLVFFRNRRWGESQKYDNEFLDYPSLRIINIDEIWAREIFFNTNNNITKRQTRITADSNEYVHIIIFGMSSTGETIALSAAKYCHLPNFISKGIKTKITIIDDDFSHHRGVLHGRYSDFLSRCTYSYNRIVDGKFSVIESHNPSEFDDITDIEWEFVESISDDSLLQDMLALMCMDKNKFISVFVCGHNDVENINIALGLPKIYFDNSIPIWLYAKRDYSIQDYLKGSRYDNIHIWGKAGGLKLDGLIIEEGAIKLVEWENNLFAGGSISWQSESIDNKQDRIDAIAAVPIMVESMGFYTEDEDDFMLYDCELSIYVRVEHVRWVVSRLIAGYRPTNRDLEKDLDYNNSYQYRNTIKKHFLNKYIVHYDKARDIEDVNALYIKFYKQYWLSNRKKVYYESTQRI